MKRKVEQAHELAPARPIRRTHKAGYSLRKVEKSKSKPACYKTTTLINICRGNETKTLLGSPGKPDGNLDNA